MEKIIVENFGYLERQYRAISAVIKLGNELSIELIYFVPSKINPELKIYRMVQYLGYGKFEAIRENREELISQIEKKLSEVKNKSL